MLRIDSPYFLGMDSPILGIDSPLGAPASSTTFRPPPRVGAAFADSHRYQAKENSQSKAGYPECGRDQNVRLRLSGVGRNDVATVACPLRLRSGSVCCRPEYSRIGR
jgi:hypothetical protein